MRDPSTVARTVTCAATGRDGTARVEGMARVAAARGVRDDGVARGARRPVS